MATTRIYDGTGVVSTPAKATQAATTLYVRSTGNDSNVGTLASPLLTIQEAVNRIPDVIGHAVTVDVGTGTFAGFLLSGKSIKSSITLTITGALKTATVATGSATGTSNGGDLFTMSDSTQIWTVDDLKGKWVSVPSGKYLIASNTSTTITLAGRATVTMSGLAYTIQENDTTINSTPEFSAIVGGNVVFRYFNIDATGKTYGLWTDYSSTWYTFVNLRISSPTYGGIYSHSNTNVWARQCYVTGFGTVGIAFSYSHFSKIDGCYVTTGGTASGAGYSFDSTRGAFLGYSAAVTSAPGLKIKNCIVEIEKINSSSSGTDGILVTDGTILYTSTYTGNGTLSGTGNTNYGLRLVGMGKAQFSSASDITGTLGDLTIDDLTPITWASFSSIGDSIVNPNTFSRVERSA